MPKNTVDNRFWAWVSSSGVWERHCSPTDIAQGEQIVKDLKAAYHAGWRAHQRQLHEQCRLSITWTGNLEVDK